MATYEACKNISGIAGTAVTVYRLVALASDGEYDHAGAAARADGVAAESVAAGGTFPLAIPNGAVVKVEAGGVVAVGDKLASDANGKAVTNANPGVGGYWVGIARSAAGADGEVIEMQFIVDQDQVA
jgi:hypothetical protein